MNKLDKLLRKTRRAFSLEKNAAKALTAFKYLFLQEKATVIIPCYNEAKTLGRVVKQCSTSPLVSEVVVVDDGSTDNSSEAATSAGARVVRHAKNKGKGAAIMTGAHAARNSVLIFIDADYENVSQTTIEALAMPLMNGEASVCKATFDRDGGRVTELVAKPLLEFVFPEVTLRQPLSGQFAIRKEFLQKLDVSTDWGIDMEIVLESTKQGERILEVNIGRVDHKHRPLSELSTTSKQVIRTILQKAGFLAQKHKLIILDFDNTLIAESSITALAEEFGFKKKLARERKNHYKGKITERELTRRIAAMLRGLSGRELREASRKLRKRQFADETLVYLKRMGYKTAIVSYAFRHVITSCFDPSLFDAIICPTLEERNGKITGKAEIPNYLSESGRVYSKGNAAVALMRKFKSKPAETIAVGDSESDQDMFAKVGLPVAIGEKTLEFASVNIKSLPELMIIAS